MAIPVVLLTILIGFALATAAVVASLASQRGTVRDERSKAAIAAAESGVEQALLRYNRYLTAAPQPCLAMTAGGTVAPASPTGGWCPAVSGTVTGQPDDTYSYSVRPCGLPSSSTSCSAIQAGEAASSLEIVSTGNVNGVSRRVEVVAKSSGGLTPFTANASVIGLDSINVAAGSGSTPTNITANVATNGNVTLQTGSELNCDYASVGPGRVVTAPGQATCTAQQGTTSLPPINQGDVKTNNSNGRFFAQDPITPACSPDASACWTGDSATAYRQLTLRSNRTLTMGGANYSVCKLTIESNAALYVQAGARVQIYFLPPEECPGLASVNGSYNQLDMSSNSRMTVTGSSPGHLALLFVGSDALRTDINFASNTSANQSCEQDFVVYAPRTNISIDSNSTFCGAMAGKTVFVNSNSSVTASNTADDFELPNSVAAHYSPESFLECQAQGASPTAPDGGC